MKVRPDIDRDDLWRSLLRHAGMAAAHEELADNAEPQAREGHRRLASDERRAVRHYIARLGLMDSGTLPIVPVADAVADSPDDDDPYMPTRQWCIRHQDDGQAEADALLALSNAVEDCNDAADDDTAEYPATVRVQRTAWGEFRVVEGGDAA